ncbi:MAG: hypothetical protein JJE55_08225 [Flavobacteriaceae bacterium]|nr:hypothetical protein [Flavobacteriaceae bacterium]
MPTNFPEVWSDRFIQNLTEASVAPWLDGIPELSANVQVVNAGSITEKNVINVAATDFDVDVLINNTAYPIAVQAYDDETLTFNLDKYQTKVTSINDDDTLGASYDKIDVITKSHKRGILEAKYQKAIHSLAPATNTAATPVIVATGGPDGLKDGTRFRLAYEDLVASKEATKGFKGEKRLVLTETHFNDLLLDRKNFGDKLVNYNEGTTAPKIAGFKIYQYDGDMPIFTGALAKKAYGAILEAGDREASVIFTDTAVAKKTGITKQYFAPAATNPAGQTNDLAYRHYFLAVPFRAEKIAAVISGTYVAAP